MEQKLEIGKVYINGTGNYLAVPKKKLKNGYKAIIVDVSGKPMPENCLVLRLIQEDKIGNEFGVVWHEFKGGITVK